MPGLGWKHDELLQTTMALLEHIAQCARRGQHGEWIVTPGQKTGQHRLGASFIDDVANAAHVVKPMLQEMPDTNQLPIDVAWVEQVDAAAERLAVELDSLVVLTAAQKDKKAAISVGGHARAGPQLEAMVTGNLPRFLRTMAALSAAIDAQMKGKPQ